MASYHDEKMTLQELRSFHRIDREIYRYLAINLGKDPLVSMGVIALWMFMEELGYPIIILELLKNQSDVITESAFDEAVSAVQYIITSIPPPPPFYPTAVTDMPTTLSLIRDYGSAMYVSMKYLFENGEGGCCSLRRIIRNVCYRTFGDIFKEAMVKNGLGDNADKINEATNIPNVHLEVLAAIPGNIIEPEPMTSVKCEVGSSSGTSQGDQRTLFVTFSRGFPISPDQIREFFIRTYGENCIESIYMQQVCPPERRESMYAMIVFNAPEIIDKILGGEEKVCFLISGRNIQARKLK